MNKLLITIMCIFWLIVPSTSIASTYPEKTNITRVIKTNLIDITLTVNDRKKTINAVKQNGILYLEQTSFFKILEDSGVNFLNDGNCVITNKFICYNTTTLTSYTNNLRNRPVYKSVSILLHGDIGTEDYLSVGAFKILFPNIRSVKFNSSSVSVKIDKQKWTTSNIQSLFSIFLSQPGDKYAPNELNTNDLNTNYRGCIDLWKPTATPANTPVPIDTPFAVTPPPKTERTIQTKPYDTTVISQMVENEAMILGKSSDESVATVIVNEQKQITIQTLSTGNSDVQVETNKNTYTIHVISTVPFGGSYTIKKGDILTQKIILAEGETIEKFTWTNKEIASMWLSDKTNNLISLSGDKEGTTEIGIVTPTATYTENIIVKP